MCTDPPDNKQLCERFSQFSVGQWYFATRFKVKALLLTRALQNAICPGLTHPRGIVALGRATFYPGLKKMVTGLPLNHGLAACAHWRTGPVCQVDTG